MNPRLKKVYKENLQILDSIKELEIESAIEEQYFFEGKLSEESRGALKLQLSNGKEITFKCDVDSESIKIRKGGFTNKENFEAEFEDGRYKWKEKEFLNRENLKTLGKIKQTKIEFLISNCSKIQSGCRLIFQNNHFLHIWTMSSDCIFYGINQEPNYYKDENLRIELK